MREEVFDDLRHWPRVAAAGRGQLGFRRPEDDRVQAAPPACGADRRPGGKGAFSRHAYEDADIKYEYYRVIARGGRVMALAGFVLVIGALLRRYSKPGTPA